MSVTEVARLLEIPPANISYNLSRPDRGDDPHQRRREISHHGSRIRHLAQRTSSADGQDLASSVRNLIEISFVVNFDRISR
ncbi:hypothetical protein J7J63_08185 [Candidatus Bipolaricaulota bacterium]|nr:hypothetical protein [Candidatus Bipolaricaulota bacterium]